ncbi:MAG: hypothetical protein PF638_16260 [Candidatus Delongbacteria bacterium]|jgi:hypothetical protein|nr:hypothetical protein [Candidatus Delongbacteria bacterium]
MKNMIKVILVLIFLISLASCEKNSVSTDDNNWTAEFSTPNEETTISKSTETDAVVDFDFHNGGLEYVYSKLLEVKENHSQSKTAEENWWGNDVNLKEMTLSFVQGYFFQTYGDQIGELEYDKALEPGLMAAQMSADDAIEYVMLSNLNTVTKSYIDQILSIDMKNFGTVESSLKKIRNDARKELSGDDLATVLNIIEISLSSAKYWKDNLDKWAALFEESEEQPAYASWWENILIGDMAGAAVGQIAGGGDGNIGGTASLVSSAVVAVVELWDWWF